MNHRNRRKPFHERSARERKLAYIRMKNNIRRSASVLGGLFYTHDYVHGQNGWVDIYFLGKEKGVFYNVTLQTARYEYKEEVSQAAWDAADAMVPHRFNLFEDAKKDPVTGYYVSNPKPEGPLDVFGGLTRWDWIKAEEARIAEARTVKVHARVELDRDYAHGIGLHATVDVPFLTVDAINAFIGDFLANGEKAWRDDKALSFSHEEVGYWGLESNAIVEPWEVADALAKAAESDGESDPAGSDGKSDAGE
jgi:hypothetical protein